MSFRRWLRLSTLLAALPLAACAVQAVFESAALAAPAYKPKVAVGGFAGDKKGELRDAFLAALRNDGSYELTDAEDVKSTDSTRAVADAAKAMDVSVVITGKVVGSTLKLKIMGADGRQLRAPELKGAGRAKLKTTIEKSAAASVAPGVDEATAAERARAEEEERAQKESEAARASVEAKADDDDESAGGELSPLDVTAGLRAMSRKFKFHQGIAELRPNDGFASFLDYKLPLGPAVFVDLNWYPGAHFARGQAERIGLSAGYEKGFAISTVYEPEGAAKQTLSTNEQAFYIGARYRLPLGVHELGAAGTFGQHTFELEGDDAAPLVPDVKYTYLKLGLDGTMRVGDVLLGARLGKRFVTGTGSLESVWFPGSVKTSSLEAGVSVGYRVMPAVEVIGSFDFLRYAFDFNPVRRRPGYESVVAGGAVDQYWFGSVGVRVRLPAASEAAPAAPSKPPPDEDDEDEDD